MNFARWPNIVKLLNYLKRFVKWFIFSAGCIGIIMLIVSFTSLPFWGYYWLGTSAGLNETVPDYIVIMGGSAMPGRSTLIRTYYAAGAAQRFPDSKIIIALPGDLSDENSSVNLVKKELVLRNVSPDRILTENIGTNTRYQALEMKKLLSEPNPGVLVVTSPEHVRRAVLSIRKAGCPNVYGLPAFDETNDFILYFNDDELGGRNKFLPEIGSNLQIRYQFWQHLEYEILITREFLALGFYFLKGWI